jgi:hypothetical protein
MHLLFKLIIYRLPSVPLNSSAYQLSMASIELLYSLVSARMLHVIARIIEKNIS